MRIIAIGVEEQLSSREHSVPEIAAVAPISDEFADGAERDEVSGDEARDEYEVSPKGFLDRTTLPSATIGTLDETREPPAAVTAPLETQAAILPPRFEADVEEAASAPVEASPDGDATEIEAIPEEVAEVIHETAAVGTPAGVATGAEPVLSRRPPPPPRRSMPSGVSEPHIAVAEVSSKERERASAELTDARPMGESVEPPESIETVETVEPVEPSEPIEAPLIPAAPALPREGAMPTPPSRVPREPPPRPKPKTETPVEPSAAEAGAPVSEAPAGDRTKARGRRPWWEELFNEDFSRALVRLTEHQIEQEVTFIEDSLGVAPGAVVLDLGCGSGEHAVELASRGYGVVGYDLSLHQLALAQETAQERGQKLNFLQGDMREMAFEEVFDGIYCWNTTFGYFEEDKNINVAERMFAALKPGGALLIDIINRDFAAGDQPSSVWFEGDCCVCMDDMNIDFLTSRMRVKRSLILDDGRTRECTYSIRLYSLHELGKILHSAGFRVTEASGHPTTPGVFLGQSSPRIIILAQKP